MYSTTLRINEVNASDDHNRSVSTMACVDLNAVPKNKHKCISVPVVTKGLFGIHSRW